MCIEVIETAKCTSRNKVINCIHSMSRDPSNRFSNISEKATFPYFRRLHERSCILNSRPQWIEYISYPSGSILDYSFYQIMCYSIGSTQWIEPAGWFCGKPALRCREDRVPTTVMSMICCGCVCWHMQNEKRKWKLFMLRFFLDRDAQYYYEHEQCLLHRWLPQ